MQNGGINTYLRWNVGCCLITLKLKMKFITFAITLSLFRDVFENAFHTSAFCDIRNYSVIWRLKVLSNLEIQESCWELPTRCVYGFKRICVLLSSWSEVQKKKSGGILCPIYRQQYMMPLQIVKETFFIYFHFDHNDWILCCTSQKAGLECVKARLEALQSSITVHARFTQK